MKTEPKTTTDSTSTQAIPRQTAHAVGAPGPAASTTAPPPVHRPRPVRGPVFGAVAAIIVAAAIAIGIATQPGGTPDGEQVSVETQNEQSALERLVQLGYVPAEALQPTVTEDVLTRRLQARGLVPTGPAAHDPLGDAAHERSVTRSLVQHGLVPAAALEPTTERGHTQSLVVRGLLPDGA